MSDNRLLSVVILASSLDPKTGIITESSNSQFKVDEKHRLETFLSDFKINGYHSIGGHVIESVKSNIEKYLAFPEDIRLYEGFTTTVISLSPNTGSE